MTAVFFPRPQRLCAPSHPARCSFAFVNHRNHSTPGWTPVVLELFPGDHLRSAHVIKMVVTRQGTRPVVYADFKHTRHHSFRADAALFAAAFGGRAAVAADVAVLKHPNRRIVSIDAEVNATLAHMASDGYGAHSAVAHEIQHTALRMRLAGLDTRAPRQMADTCYMLWRPTAHAAAFGLRWFHEVEVGSMRVQVSMLFAAERVPGLTLRFLPYAWKSSAVAVNATAQCSKPDKRKENSYAERRATRARVLGGAARTSAARGPP